MRECGKGERPEDRSPFPYASSALVGVLIAVLVLVGVLLLVLVLLLHRARLLSCVLLRGIVSPHRKGNIRQSSHT